MSPRAPNRPTLILRQDYIFQMHTVDNVACLKLLASDIAAERITVEDACDMTETETVTGKRKKFRSTALGSDSNHVCAVQLQSLC